MDHDTRPTLVVVDPQPPDPVDEGVDLGRPIAPRDVNTEMNEGVAARSSLAIPGPPPADGDFDLDHRLEPIDVGSLEEPDLDLSHGPARITRPGPTRTPRLEG